MTDSAVPETKPQVWAVKLGDATVQLQDLPYRQLETVCVKHGSNPAWMIDLPLRDLRCAADLVELAAIKLGVPVPFEPLDADVSMRVLSKIHADHLVMVDDDFPTVWDDQENGPSVPPVADQTTPS